MRARHAREIRRGVTTARAVSRGFRRQPALTPFGFGGAPKAPLWERAFHREMSRLVRRGVIRPPRGPSGVSRHG